jgi:hypothetical protein
LIEQVARSSVSYECVAAQVLWRDELKAALELIRNTDGDYAWAGNAAGNEVGEEGAAATRELKLTDWKKFYADARRKRVVPTCVIDFPYSDNKSLTDDLLERMYCFKGVDDDRRVVVHVHTILRWCDRGTDVKKRAMKVTSVNVRHADRKGGVSSRRKGAPAWGLFLSIPSSSTGGRACGIRAWARSLSGSGRQPRACR